MAHKTTFVLPFGYNIKNNKTILQPYSNHYVTILAITFW